MNIKLLGIDIAKNVFQLHGVDGKGKAVLKKRLKRKELLEFVVQLPRCVIALEACGGSHYWARRFKELGHEVKVISACFVKPFVKTNKNDASDAQAITEAASRPEMRYVPIKSVEQQDIQCVHRIRERLLGERTALMNQLRGLLMEYGIVIEQGISALRKRLPEILEDGENELTAMTRELCEKMSEELRELEERIRGYDKKIKGIAQAHSICEKLQEIEGIGVLSATAVLTVLGDAGLFKNGRHFAAFLGLVPKQYSSGNRQRLLGISKRGNSYIRNLLIHGARSVLQRTNKKTDKRSCWLNELKARAGYNKTSVALANKNARIIWALVANQTNYVKAV